jgi:hypothetical protein
MPLNGRTKIYPKRTGCEHPTRPRWKRYSQESWLNSKCRPSKKGKCISQSGPRQAKLRREPRSRRASSASPSRVECATESTSAQSPRNPVLFVGAAPRIPFHLRFAQSRALSRKVSDEYVVPLCRGHHREVHRCGDETEWWRNRGIDALRVARMLWLEFHPQVPSDREALV